MLQWGRDIIVADRTRRFKTISRSDRLQWGRDIIVADRLRLVSS
jgi:hypothetical protein